MRFPLIKAFWRQRLGDIPAGSTGLNNATTSQYVGEIFAKDAELSYRKAQVMAAVACSLTADQKASFGAMKFGNSNTWPALDEREELSKPGRNRDPLFNVAYMTYATEFFSWTAGSVDADTYFCPERHGTYFGGFYMKDMPAMGKRQYSISTKLTGDSGEAFINEVLTPEQRAYITAIPDLQRADLKEIASVRHAISVELRKFLVGETPDRAKVIALGRRYGELDGEMSWMYATAFAKVAATLTTGQQVALTKLRNLDGYTSAPAYIYSQPLQKEPDIPNTDAFFYPPK
jgi:Spy/CpxP family protein refolding chaperone